MVAGRFTVASGKQHPRSGGTCGEPFGPPEFLPTKPQPPNRIVIPTVVEGPAVHHPQPRSRMDAQPQPLSSRPERSVVEGSAVRPSVLPNSSY
jgi:hypothetical protein